MLRNKWLTGLGKPNRSKTCAASYTFLIEITMITKPCQYPSIPVIMRILTVLCLAATIVSAQRGGGRGAVPGQPAPAASGPGVQTQGQPVAGGQGAPAVNLPPGSVEGRVMSTTGEPLRKVSLSLRPNGRGGGN